MASPSKHALTVLADPALSTSGGQLEALKRSVIQQIHLIRRIEGEAALRGVLAGFGFHRVKLSMRGGFRAWIDEQDGLGKTQVNNLMRLASVFLEKSRANRSELLAMSSESGELMESADETVRKFLEKAQAFVGDCSLNELLIKYNIKGVTREGDDGEDPNTPGPGTDGQLYFSEVSQYLYGFRTTALRPESLARLTPEQLRAVREEHDAQNAELHQLCDKAGLGK